ncbi:MAG: hypothetical protein GY810_04710 [Aureispira sp.]|nr:hypothetical protein [Aureispira sp.]
MNQPYPKDIEKVLELLQTNTPQNISLAVLLAKSIGVDIIKELLPVFEMSLKLSFLAKLSTDLEAELGSLLKFDQLHITLPPDNNYINSLIFFHRLKVLTLALNGQELTLDFEHLNLQKLFVQDINTWPLSAVALQQLKNTKLQQLTINPNSIKIEKQHAFNIPKQLGDITSLKGLWLEHPNLEKIPNELLALKKLESLSIYSKVPLLELPQHLLELPALNYASFEKIPSRNLLNIKEQLILEFNQLGIVDYWRMAIAQRSQAKSIKKEYKSPLLSMLRQTIAFAQSINSNFFKKTLKPISVTI